MLSISICFDGTRRLSSPLCFHPHHTRSAEMFSLAENGPLIPDRLNHSAVQYPPPGGRHLCHTEALPPDAASDICIPSVVKPKADHPRMLAYPLATRGKQVFLREPAIPSCVWTKQVSLAVAMLIGTTRLLDPDTDRFPGNKQCSRISDQTFHLPQRPSESLP